MSYQKLKKILLSLKLKLVKSFKDLTWWLKYRLITKHKYHLINTNLAPSFYDLPARLLHGNFSLLVEFVEKEANQIDWKYNEDYYKAWFEINTLYLWWAKDRPLKIDRLNRMKHWKRYEFKCQLEATDEEMLIRLIKIQKFLVV